MRGESFQFSVFGVGVGVAQEKGTQPIPFGTPIALRACGHKRYQDSLTSNVTSAATRNSIIPVSPTHPRSGLIAIPSDVHPVGVLGCVRAGFQGLTHPGY